MNISNNSTQFYYKMGYLIKNIFINLKMHNSIRFL